MAKAKTTKRPGSIPRNRTPRSKAYYDFVAGSANADGGGNKRRAAVVEYKEEDGLYTQMKRLQGTNLARAAMRNLASMRGMMKQLRVNVVGPLGKLYILDESEPAKTAMSWFNGTWAKAAEFRDGLPFGELLQLIVSSTANEGDIVTAFDDGTITGGDGSGRIVAWESDQIANLESGFFGRTFPTHKQENGIIRDMYGRNIGAVVTAKRGHMQVDPDDAYILTRDPLAMRSDVWWNHVKRQWRLNQGRGTPESTCAINLMLDNYEILAKEMQTAKVRAALAGIVRKKENIEDFDDSRLDPDVEATDLAGVTDGNDELTTGSDVTPQKNYDRMEALTGGYMEYVDADDEIVFPDIDRPNVNIADFLKYTTDLSGHPYGLAHAYSGLKADTSYTAFRGDLVMSWVSIRDNQKWLERHVADWAAVQALRWAVKTGRLKPLPDGWENKLAWQWPVAPEVDEEKAEKGIAAKLKNGRVTYSQLIGPGWREHFDQLGKELEYIQEKGLPLGIFETKSGGTTNANENDSGNEPGNTNEGDDDETN